MSRVRVLKLYDIEDVDDGTLRSLGAEAIVGNYQRGNLPRNIEEELREAPSVEVGPPSKEFVEQVSRLVENGEPVAPSLISAVETASEQHEGNHLEIVSFLENRIGKEVMMGPSIQDSYPV